MEESGCPRSRSSQGVDLVDDECSTDSGCSTGGSTGSAEVLSRRDSGYGERMRGRSSVVQDRAKHPHSHQHQQQQRRGGLKQKSSRSWSPEDRVRFRSGSSSPSHSPSHSQTTSEGPGSGDNDSFKRASAARGLRKAFLNLGISTRLEAPLHEKPSAKKSQKRILRSPVAYTYVKGLSGLPTQRIPRNAV